jgi:hypothetical protein
VRQVSEESFDALFILARQGGVNMANNLPLHEQALCVRVEPKTAPDPQAAQGRGPLYALLSRRDFLKISASGIIVLALKPQESFSQQINSELNAYGNSSYTSTNSTGAEHVRYEPWRLDLSTPAAQLHITRSDITRPSHLNDNAPSAALASIKNFFEDSPIVGMAHDMQRDLDTIFIYVVGNLLGHDLAPNIRWNAGAGIIDIVSKFESIGEHIDVAIGEKPVTESYAQNTIYDAVNSGDVAKSMLLENKADKSNNNACETARAERDLNNLHLRDPAQRSEHEIDHEQYERETRETERNTA